MDHVEEWAPIFGYENYAISDLGRLYSVPRGGTKGGYLKPVLQWTGYFQYALGSGCRRSAHCFVAEAFIGLPPAGYCVDHINGVKTDNRLSNLRYITTRENSQQNKPRGERVGLSKLKNADVLEIRRLRHSGRTCVEVALRFGVDPRTVNRIDRRETWKHI